MTQAREKGESFPLPPTEKRKRDRKREESLNPLRRAGKKKGHTRPYLLLQRRKRRPMSPEKKRLGEKEEKTLSNSWTQEGDGRKSLHIIDRGERGGEVLSHAKGGVARGKRERPNLFYGWKKGRGKSSLDSVKKGEKIYYDATKKRKIGGKEKGVSFLQKEREKVLPSRTRRKMRNSTRAKGVEVRENKKTGSQARREEK